MNRRLRLGIIAVAGLLGLLNGLGRLEASEGAGEYLEHKVVIETLIGEGQNQGLIGMTAISEVIRNRMVERGLSAYEVVLQPKQFSFWNDRNRARAWLVKNARLADYEQAEVAWERSEHSHLTNSSTLYWNPRLANPSWAKRVTKTVKIGDHQFAREQ